MPRPIDTVAVPTRTFDNYTTRIYIVIPKPFSRVVSIRGITQFVRPIYIYHKYVPFDTITTHLRTHTHTLSHSLTHVSSLYMYLYSRYTNARWNIISIVYRSPIYAHGLCYEWTSTAKRHDNMYMHRKPVFNSLQYIPRELDNSATIALVHFLRPAVI